MQEYQYHLARTQTLLGGKQSNSRQAAEIGALVSGWWGDYSIQGYGSIFEPGQTEITIPIATFADSFAEGTETLNFTIKDLGAIKSSRNYRYRGASTGWSRANIYLQPLTIEDNSFRVDILDRPREAASFSISDSTIEEGRSGSVSITRSGDNSTTQTVKVSVTGGSALPGTDCKHIDNGQTIGNQTFNGTSNAINTIFFSEGESEKRFEIITYDNHPIIQIGQ